MQCEYNPDKENLQLVLQLSDILTCIYQVIHLAHFPPPTSPYPTAFSPFPSCRSALFPTPPPKMKGTKFFAVSGRMSEMIPYGW